MSQNEEIEEIHGEGNDGSEAEEGTFEEIDSYTDDSESEPYDEQLEIDQDASEDEEEEAPQYIRGLAPLPDRDAGPAGPSQEKQLGPDDAKPWHGLERLPGATKAKYVELLSKLRISNKTKITILLLGKHYVGKSHTVNSLLNEEAAPRQFMNREAQPTTAYNREAHDFVLSLIDTSGATDFDFFSVQRAEDVAESIERTPVDVVLYVDRFDMFRTDGTDKEVIKGLTNFFGASIWNNTVIALTNAAGSVDAQRPWEEFAERRSKSLRDAIRRFSGNQKAELPAAFIENATSCKQNDAGEKILPDGKAWLPELMEKVTDVASKAEPYHYDKRAIAKTTNPNRKLRWLVPVFLAAQIALKVLVLDPLLDDDKHTGDKSGPYKAKIVKGRRAIAELEKQGKHRQAYVRRAELYQSDDD